MAFELKKG